VTRNLGSSGPLSLAIVYLLEYKRALFRASRRMVVLLEPYSELKGPMKFAYFLSPPPPQTVSVEDESRYVAGILFLVLSSPRKNDTASSVSLCV
jgi:hypothetical protein